MLARVSFVLVCRSLVFCTRSSRVRIAVVFALCADAFFRVICIAHVQEEELLRHFLVRIRNHSPSGSAEMPYSNSLVVDQIEANLAQTIATRFAAHIERYANPDRIPDTVEHTKTAQASGDVIGIWTDDTAKERYCYTTTQYMREQKIAFAKDCICVTTDGNRHNPKIVENKPDATLDELKLQLQRFTVVQKETNTGGAPRRTWVLTGKLGGRCDDLAMALQILVYHTHLRILDPVWVRQQIEKSRSLFARSTQ